MDKRMGDLPIKRKGYSCRHNIPANILEDLSHGRMETATLAEALAIDLTVLLKTTFPHIPLQHFDPIKSIHSSSWLMKMKAISHILYDNYGMTLLDQLTHHLSDSVRSWGAGVISLSSDLSLEEKLHHMKVFACDSHFGVREMAWLFLRKELMQDICKSLQMLEPWVHDTNPYMRRFAVESTRPRGVWCQHIELLKERPWMGIHLINPLMQDKEKYVQDSVGNWLNDAAKSSPTWVKEFIQSWLQSSSSKETAYICKKGLRSVGA